MERVRVSFFIRGGAAATHPAHPPDPRKNLKGFRILCNNVEEILKPSIAFHYLAARLLTRVMIPR